MPALFFFDNLCKIHYIYTSDGRKLGMSLDGSFTYYRNTLVYEGDSNIPKKMFHPEGFVDFDTDTYKYFKTDHLGNVRALLAVDGSPFDGAQSLVAEQNTDYYPFGLSHGQHENLHLNRYLFSGKELQDATIGSHGMLGWYDFGARQYNPLLGHWMTHDLLARQYTSISPYAYCMSNPVNFIDKWGLFPGGYYLTDGSIGIDPVVVYGFIPKRGYNPDPIKLRQFVSHIDYLSFGLSESDDRNRPQGGLGGKETQKPQKQDTPSEAWRHVIQYVEKSNEYLKKINTPGELLNALNKLDPSTNKFLLKYLNVTRKIGMYTDVVDVLNIVEGIADGTFSGKDYLGLGVDILGKFGAYGSIAAIGISFYADGLIWFSNYMSQATIYMDGYMKNKITRFYY